MRRLVLLVVAAILLPGCGGDSGGESLSSRREKAKKIANALDRAKQLTSIANKQHNAGDVMGARETLNDATAAAVLIDTPAGQVEELNRVALAHAKMKSTSEAKDVLKTASKAIEKIDDASKKITGLTRIAISYGQYLDSSGIGKGFLQDAEALTSQIENPEFKAQSVMEIAYAWHRLESDKDAQRLIKETLDGCRAVEDSRKRSDALVEVAATLNRMKDPEAEAVFSEAEEVVNQIEDKLSRAHALVYLGDKLGRVGRKTEAKKMFSQASKLADKVDPSMRNELIVKINTSREFLKSGS